MSVERVSRVLVLYRHPLFAHSIRTALQSQADVALVGEIDQWDLAEAAISRLEPDVIVIEEADGYSELALRALSARAAPWRLVAMRMDDTSMHILSGTWQPVTGAQDLIDALRPAATPRADPQTPRDTSNRETNGQC